MTNWTEQSEAMFQSMSDSQKRLMEAWTESLKSLGMLQDSEMWEKSINFWEENAKKTWAAQTEWTHTWIKNMSSIEGMPGKALDSAERFESMSEQWSSTQEQLWTNWFEMLRSFDPSKLSDEWAEAFKSPFQAWQQASENVMNTQSEWMRAWMGSREPASEEEVSEEEAAEE